MVTIHSEPENSALLVAVNGRGKSIWIGLREIEVSLWSKFEVKTT